SREHGPAWELKHLGGGRDGKTYALPKTRAVFLQVVADCLVPCCHESKGTTWPKAPARCTIGNFASGRCEEGRSGGQGRLGAPVAAGGPNEPTRSQTAR